MQRGPGHPICGNVQFILKGFAGWLTCCTRSAQQLDQNHSTSPVQPQPNSRGLDLECLAHHAEPQLPGQLPRHVRRLPGRFEHAVQRPAGAVLCDHTGRPGTERHQVDDVGVADRRQQRCFLLGSSRVGEPA
jgi:hypothetical protein